MNYANERDFVNVISLMTEKDSSSSIIKDYIQKNLTKEIESISR